MDITYIPMARGFVYLAVVLDWFSRRVLSWRLSITMEAAFWVGRTSTFALCNVTLQWVLQIADRGVEAAARDLKPVARAINTFGGEVTNKAVAETFGLPYSSRFAP
jgi:transposase InsO family protein